MPEIRAKCRGMYTGASSNVSASDGGMRVAENVVYELPGCASPRPGFKLASYTSSAKECARILPWGGDSSAAIRINDDNTAAWLSAPTSYITIDGSTAIDWSGGIYTFAGAVSARKNLYIVGCEGGVRKLESSADLVAPVSGMSEPPVVMTIIAGSGTAVLADNYYVAYRVVLRKKDSNDLVTRGPALGRYRFRNTSGGTINPLVSVSLPSHAAAGDILEIYRTRTSSVDPADQYYLQSERELTSANISATYVAFTDTTDDSELGAACYTNANREGFAGNNFRAPAGAAVETYAGSLFVGYIRYPGRFQLKWDEGGDRSGQSTGIGYRSVTGTLAANNTITVMSSTTGIQVGMIVSGASWSSSPAVVTAVNSGAATVTINGTWGGAAGATSLVFYDSVRVGDEYFYAQSATALITSMNITGTLVGNVPSELYFAYPLGTYGKANSSGFTNVKQVAVVIEEREAHLDADSIYATHGDEYIPALPLPNATADADIYVKNELLTNGLAYSKKDEPEHFPLGYYDRVGSASAYLLAMKATRDALWLFKTDGIYRLSGPAAPRWRIDSVDLSKRILHPNTITLIGEDIYVLTNEGVARVSDAGIDVVSAPISDQIEPMMRQMQAHFADTVGATGHWMTSDPSSGNVLLGLGSAYDSTYASKIYCFNTGTREWSTWEFPFAEEPGIE